MSGHELLVPGEARPGWYGVVANLLARLRPTPAAQDYAEVRMPQYEPRQQDDTSHRQCTGRMDARLASARTPLELRMNALMAVQQVPPRHASGLLRHALEESSDDLRLLAYGILDSKEKELATRIHAARLALQQTEAQEANYLLSKQLAELYMELVYQELVQGDLRRHALEEGSRFALQALRRQRLDAGLWLLYGRLQLLCGAYESAHSAFCTALRTGLSATRVQPYLAELAFLRGDFAAVRAQLRQLATETPTQQMALLVDYWSSHDSASGSAG